MLEKFGIEQVIDVRSFPKSKWSEYRKENLEKNLPNRRIEYFHLGGLGGYRDEGYDTYMDTEEFQKNLRKLERLADRKKTAIMCLESYPNGCHRKYIAKKLDNKGWEVIHLVGKSGKQKTLG